MQLSSLYQLEIAAMDGSVTHASFEAMCVNFLAVAKHRKDFLSIAEKVRRIILWHRCTVYEILEDIVYPSTP